MFKMFLVVPPGLEELASREINDNFEKAKFSGQQSEKILEYSVDLPNLLLANIHSRIPNRILVRLGNFTATNFPELVKKASRINWENYINQKTKISIRTTCKKSKLYHSDAVSQRILTAIQARLSRNIEILKAGLDDDMDQFIQIIVVRIINDQVEISIDSSGIPLHKRGYRPAVAKAPLRENLAAAIILASQWNRENILIDPFCGSGTIPIEAGLLKQDIPPGINREFIMEQWPVFQKVFRGKPREKLDGYAQNDNITIFGSDRDSGAIQIAKENCQRANLTSVINWSNHAVSDMPRINEPGWIITNPPYGGRISANQDLRNLYAQFGNILRKDYSGWKVIFLCTNPHLASQTQLDAKPILAFSNGGINVQAYFTEIN